MRQAPSRTRRAKKAKPNGRRQVQLAARDQTNFADGSELLSFSIDRGAPESIFRQLYGALRRLILDGIAPAGSRLPASRLVAERLGVSRASVVGVYEQLLAEGYLIGRQGAGTFVSPDMLEPLQRPPHRALARARPRHRRPTGGRSRRRATRPWRRIRRSSRPFRSTPAAVRSTSRRSRPGAG